MDILEQFGLDNDQALLLFSMQRYIVQVDIRSEKNKSLQQKKEEWLHVWENGIEDLLADSSNGIKLIKKEKLLIEKCEDVVNNCGKVKTPLYLILLELSLFTPYFSMEGFKWKFYELVTIDKKVANYNLIRFSSMLEIDESFISIYKKSFKKSLRSLSGFYTKMLVGAGLGSVLVAITAGLALPYVATLVAPAGLAGAAAINAGLAALGGGAIAAGGFGMAGGITVIVGGGSIFGALNGMALGAILGDSSDFALREGAKLEVIMREIILIAQKDVRFAQEMIKNQQMVIKKLESELAELKFNEKENKTRIKNLAKSIEYLRNSLKNSQKALEEDSHIKEDE
ncbi:hypothetical protein [Peribacillus frigoritolerans]|uniref:hypothetical protein n=1 Tax=Peribacillus frigoritolerans TaxID=450367 RepID=UPI002232959A|nr:hypothetical protein [Peribacillus frigoritolerans]UZD48723.1 hypothetical protein OMJ04_09755 [Peribacillus frigoritolerans]